MDTYIINISELYKKENKYEVQITYKKSVKTGGPLVYLNGGQPAILRGRQCEALGKKNYSKNAGMSSKKAEPGSTIAELVRLLE